MPKAIINVADLCAGNMPVADCAGNKPIRDNTNLYINLKLFTNET